MSNSTLRETCLADVHRAAGARMVEFGGWNMPVQYTSIREEHLRTRRAASLFDVSHMGRVKVSGRDAERAVERLCPLVIAGMSPGQSRYSFLLDSGGGTIDDLLVTRDLDGLTLVINASNREGDLAWIREQTRDLEARFFDMTDETAMIAVQGPAAVAAVARATGEDPGTLAYYHARADRIGSTYGIVSRTGYTGEDGFELTVPAAAGAGLWSRLIADGGGEVAPAGLGARDTLRLEAAMPLYGHELTRQISPLAAGLKRFVDFANPSFIGRGALEAEAARGPDRKAVCLRGDSKRIARDGDPLFRGETRVGVVTSGTFSPTFEAPIAMAMVTPDVSVGERLEAEVRGKREPLTVVKRPFYRRPAN